MTGRAGHRLGSFLISGPPVLSDPVLPTVPCSFRLEYWCEEWTRCFALHQSLPDLTGLGHLDPKGLLRLRLWCPVMTFSCTWRNSCVRLEFEETLENSGVDGVGGVEQGREGFVRGEKGPEAGNLMRWEGEGGILCEQRRDECGCNISGAAVYPI